ncbi:alcohol dehydrogenase catalytic domain-containing protein [Flavobacterium sp. LAR06]|uniref:alcohol dehydrogenase catalytic domain-containing protein n=1 Tax=Flavobacterium sp. LAR06 TaxID=3064897 RepID=UPI0035C003D7
MKTISINSAVINYKGAPFKIEELNLKVEPRPNEVLVKVVATGICQTDVHIRNQHYSVPLPIVLGHEGAGIVAQIGDAEIIYLFHPINWGIFTILIAWRKVIIWKK